jgi:large subunit ribosomal protein L29
MASLTQELRECETDELESRLIEARQELFNLRFQNVTGQLDNSSRLGHVRRQVARINTLLREREIEAAEAAEAESGAEIRPTRRAAPAAPAPAVLAEAEAADAVGGEEPAGGPGPTSDEVTD